MISWARKPSARPPSAFVDPAADHRPYSTLCGVLQAQDLREMAHAVGVVGAQPDVGASTVARNLALAGAETAGAKPVLLVDAHLARPSQTDFLAGVRLDLPGLSEVMLGRALADEVVQPTVYPGLSLVTCGDTRLRPGVDRDRFAAALARWRERCCWIVVDMPPALEAGPALTLLSLLDEVILVVESGRTSSDHAQHARILMERSQARLLGAVMNEKP